MLTAKVQLHFNLNLVHYAEIHGCEVNGEKAISSIILHYGEKSQRVMLTNGIDDQKEMQVLAEEITRAFRYRSGNSFSWERVFEGIKKKADPQNQESSP